MFAGHIGAALALGRAERRVNVAALMGAAMLLDFVLWVLVLLGIEAVRIPADFPVTHQAEFDFPWSHGLAGAALWSAFAAALAARTWPAAGARAAAVVAAAVFSHWLLDALVHRPELPLLGAASPRVGLGLWGDMPLALGVESAILVAGLAVFLRGSGLARGRAIGLAALAAVILAFTILGMTVAPPPPSVTAMAASSLVTIAAVCALAAWCAGRRRG